MARSFSRNTGKLVATVGLVAFGLQASPALSDGFFEEPTNSAAAETLAKTNGFLVALNQSKILKLTKPAASIVVANPAIADITVEGSDMLLVLGRAYGSTNLMVLDRDGNTITDLEIQVVADNSGAVTLSRGAGGQLTYNCTPRCERVFIPTDNPEALDALVKGTTSTTDLARNAADAAKK